MRINYRKYHFLKMKCATYAATMMLMVIHQVHASDRRGTSFDYQNAALEEVSHCLDHLHSIKATGENTPVEVVLSSESCGDGRDRVTARVMADTCPVGSMCTAVLSEMAVVEFGCDNTPLSRTCTIVDSCLSDDECADESWCRPTVQGRSERSECVKFQQNVGDVCQGFGDNFHQQRCSAGLKCDGASFGQPGTCANYVGCNEENDCGVGGWCRILDGTGMAFECVYYLTEGDTCSGFVPPYAQTRCGPSLSCVSDDPSIPDLSGTCQPNDSIQECSSDGECSESSWCRDSKCVPYRFMGEECTTTGPGFATTSPGASSTFEKCHPSTVCTAKNDMLPGSSGICESTNPAEPGCSSDIDCSSDSWCRPLDEFSTEKSCIPYRSIGEACSGNVPEWTTFKCDPSLACTPYDPNLPDGPATCIDPDVAAPTPAPTAKGRDDDTNKHAGGSWSTEAIAVFSVAGLAFCFAIVAAVSCFFLSNNGRGNNSSSNNRNTSKRRKQDPPSTSEDSSTNDDSGSDDEGDIESGGQP